RILSRAVPPRSSVRPRRTRADKCASPSSSLPYAPRYEHLAGHELSARAQQRRALDFHHAFLSAQLEIDCEKARGVLDVDSLLIAGVDRKSTRLNSSHVKISYAVFCLKKKKNATQITSAEK